MVFLVGHVYGPLAAECVERGGEVEGDAGDHGQGEADPVAAVAQTGPARHVPLRPVEQILTHHCTVRSLYYKCNYRVVVLQPEERSVQTLHIPASPGRRRQ